MPGEIEQQAITMAVRVPCAMINTGRSLSSVLMAAIRLALNTLRGATNLTLGAVDKLSKSDPLSANRKIRDLHLDEMQSVSSQDVRQLRREFARNNVNFAVKRSPTKGEYTVFFNAQDSKRMQQAFETVLAKQAEKTAAKKPPLAERMAAAEKEAARRNVERSAERVAERAIKAPAKEAR